MNKTFVFFFFVKVNFFGCNSTIINLSQNFQKAQRIEYLYEMLPIQAFKVICIIFIFVSFL